MNCSLQWRSYYNTSSDGGHMNKNGVLQLVILLAVLTQQAFPQNIPVFTHSFTEIPTSLPGIMTGRAVWGDYDNDGDLDIFLSGDTSDGNYISRIFRNDAGNFVNTNSGITGVAPNGLVGWGDYDNDGDLDIIIGGPTGPGSANPITKIYRNNGGSFVDVNAGLPGLIGGSVDWGDYDNDGDLDLLIMGAQAAGNYITRIYRNNAGVFTNISGGLPGVWGSSARWGDYDNDGDLDVMLTGYGSWGVTSLLFRNDDGNFAVVPEVFYPVNSGAVAWGDYDNDGDLDLLYSGELDGSDSVSITTIYQNNSGNFVDILPGFVPLICSAAWGDFDHDGDLDVITAGAGRYGGYNLRAIVYRNNSGTFVSIDSLTGVFFSSVEWGDYDNDGDFDILLTGATSNSIPFNPVTKLYRNNLGSNTFSQNTPPTVPPGLHTNVAGNSVTLSWNKATDAQTPQDGLTYNIRIGTTPGGSEVVAPMSIPSTGVRTVVQLGNTNHRTSWTIHNLTPGTYYWTVQAIDNAFAGSAFAAEQSFTVGSPTTQPAPRILSVKDVPNDQGRRVTVRWQASSLDTNVNHLPHYSIWRALPESANAIRTRPVTPHERTGIQRSTHMNGMTYVWEWLANVPAHRFPFYAYTAPTLYDSSSLTDGRHYFLVSAHTPDPNIFYDSNVDSGYSVDNLPPNGPQNFHYASLGQAILFRWNHPGDNDIAHYRLYRSPTPNFNADVIEPYAVVTDTEYLDVQPQNGWWYASRAVDISGNVGPKSNEILLLTVEVRLRLDGIPKEFALFQNYPNPFNPSTTIDFDLPRDGFATIRVFNTLGQEVHTMVNRTLSAGRYRSSFDATGLRSGVYFYQLSTSEPETGTVLFRQVRKMLLLK